MFKLCRYIGSRQMFQGNKIFPKTVNSLDCPLWTSQCLFRWLSLLYTSQWHFKSFYHTGHTCMVSHHTIYVSVHLWNSIVLSNSSEVMHFLRNTSNLKSALHASQPQLIKVLLVVLTFVLASMFFTQTENNY